MANILEQAQTKLKRTKLLNKLTYGEETELLEDLAYKTNFTGVTVRLITKLYF